MVFMEYINLFLSSINIFKLPIQLQIKKKRSFSSKVGECISILIHAFLLYLFIISDAFSKRNPLIYEKDQVNQNYTWFEFNEKNFYISFTLADSSLTEQYPPDPTIYSFVAIFMKKVSDPITGMAKVSPTTVPLTLCKESIYQELYPMNFFIYYPYSVCLPNPKLTLGGASTEPEFSFLQIKLITCDNQTSLGQCKSQEEIDSFFSNKAMGFMRLQHFIDPENYEHPVTQKFTAIPISIDKHFSKSTTHNLEKISIVSDDNLIYSTLTAQESYFLSSQTSEFSSNTSLGLYSFNFISTNLEKKIIRVYPKLQNALSNNSKYLHYTWVSIGQINPS